MQLQVNSPLLSRCAVGVLLALGWASAQAAEFSTENGWKANISTTVSLGANWRAEAQDMSLVSKGDGEYVGKLGGTGGSNTEAGNLNWDKGDRFSTLAKAVVDFSITRDEIGMFARAKAWYDQALNNETVRYGNLDNGFKRGGRLSDASQPALNKFDGVEILDLYGYNTIYVGQNQNPLQVRLGKQVVNWGESLFIQGLNQLNPVDLPALRKPGTEVKEALLPVWGVSGNLGLKDGVSLEAFYQLKWESSNIDNCGLFWSPIEYAFATSVGSGCAGRATTLGTSGNPTATVANTVALTNGQEGKDSGQGGFALRMPIEAIDSEIGFYAIRINSRTPFTSAVLGKAAGYSGVANPAIYGANAKVVARLTAATPPKGFWEYPNGINVLGASLSGNLAGMSWGAELSVTPNQPVQLNVTDIIAAAINDAGPLVAARNATGEGGTFHGYDRMRKTQVQLNAITALPALLGASQGSLVAELGLQWNDLPDNGRRYGRAFIFGLGRHPSLGNTCPGNPQPQGCENDGYVTKFATGYRVRASFDYVGVLESGFTLTPSLYLGHDVRGFSSDGQFNEGRISTTLGLRAVYQKQLQFDLGYTTFANSAKYDSFRDRDYYSASVTRTF